MTAENLPKTNGVEYRIIQGFPDYAIGDDGSVWSKRVASSWRKLKCSDHDGYVAVSLCKEERHQVFHYVHRLVLINFVGPCPDGMEACHFPDATRSNNSLANLRWDTPKENSNDSEIHGTRAKGITNGSTVLTEEIVKDARERYDHHNVSMSMLAKELGVDVVTVFDFIKGKTWMHVGGPVKPGKLPQKKLTMDIAVAIFNRYSKFPNRHEVAAEFGVSEATVRDIVKGRTWKSISA